MKNLYRILSSVLGILLFVAISGFKKLPLEPGAMIGAWGSGSASNKTVMIVTDKVFSVAVYDLPGKKLLHSYGGTWTADGGKMVKTIEWDSKDSTQVGRLVTEEADLVKGKWTWKTTGQTWNQLDDGTPGALKGAWVITGNYTNDKVSKRPSPFYPRRTMKVLSGKYFHWIAYHVANKTFINAGGGTYTSSNGKYAETIEFFTKTPESVGKTVSFDYSFVDGDWRHKGEKSTGGPLDECWTPRATLEKQ